jgi:integrase
MARQVKDANLQSREARSRLKPRGRPFWKVVEKGAHVGYRRLRAKPGTFVARFYIGNQDYEVERLGAADDLSDADGAAVLSYWQAVAETRRRMVERAHAGKPSGPYTTDDAMRDYLAFLRSEGRPEGAVQDAEHRYRALIAPALGGCEVAKITAEEFRKWRDDLVKMPPRLRTKRGAKQQYREVPDDAEARRRRRSTANRIWAICRAALSHAFSEGKVSSDAAWRKVKPFKGVDGARNRYLSIAEAKRLVNASDPDFRPLLQAALLTGGRYGALAALVVSDFNSDSGTLQLSSRKGDGSLKTFHVHLSPEAQRFFGRMCAGRAGSDLIFRKADGSPWGKSHQDRPMEEASARARISPPVNFHVARHSFASHAVMNGTPLLVVAQALGHKNTKMVEAHYGHLSARFSVEAIRKGAPRFGFKVDRKVAVLRG